MDEALLALAIRHLPLTFLHLIVIFYGLRFDAIAHLVGSNKSMPAENVGM
jgi:hypothetical protein